MFRSIASVVTGVVVWGVLWVGINSGLASAMPDSFDANGITTEPGLLAVFMAVSMVLSVLAGWLCAAIAPSNPMKHVGVLAAIQLLIGVGVQASAWSLMPLWYHLIFLAAVVPMHLLGGKIRAGGSG